MAAALYSTFVGIDVSKNTLDLCVLNNGSSEHFQIENSVDALKSLFKADPRIKACKLKKTLFCFEQMGFYNNHLYSVLEAKKALFSVQSPLHLKKSMGLVRGKSDKIDAERIAQFAAKNSEHLKLWVRPREIITRLQALNAIKKRLLTLKVILKTPLKETSSFVAPDFIDTLKTSCSASITAVENDLKELDNRMLQLIKNDDRLTQLYERITSVPRIGKIIAIKLIVVTNEFKNFDTANEFASYAGVAPFTYQSGTSLNSKGHVSFYGNKEVKSLLHLAVLGCLRDGGELKRYYERKVAEGKNSMSVLNAMKNKLIKQVFACVKQDRNYEMR